MTHFSPDFLSPGNEQHEPDQHLTTDGSTGAGKSAGLARFARELSAGLPAVVVIDLGDDSHNGTSYFEPMRAEATIAADPRPVGPAVRASLLAPVVDSLVPPSSDRTPPFRSVSAAALRETGGETTERRMESARETRADTITGRRRYLEGLRSVREAGADGKTRSFTPDEIRQVREPLALFGLPLHRITEFARAGEETSDHAHGNGKMTTLASMELGGEHDGRMTFHDAFFGLDAEGRAATALHEQTHSLSPLLEENNEVYGGREERLAAVGRVEAVVNQSLLTGVHLNGYHEHLLAQYQQGEIDRWRLVEETSAIMTEMSIFKRGGLAIAQEQQHRVMDDIARAADRVRATGNVKIDDKDSWFTRAAKQVVASGQSLTKVDLVTIPPESGSSRDGQPVRAAGADITTIRLMNGAGVNNYEGFMQHIADAKAALNWRGPNDRYQRRQQLAA